MTLWLSLSNLVVSTVSKRELRNEQCSNYPNFHPTRHTWINALRFYIVISGVRNCFFYYFRSYPFSIWIFFQFMLFFLNSLSFYRRHILDIFQNLYLIVKRFMIFNESNIYSFRKFISTYLSQIALCVGNASLRKLLCVKYSSAGLIELARETCPSLFSRVFLVLLTPESEKKAKKCRWTPSVDPASIYIF